MAINNRRTIILRLLTVSGNSLRSHCRSQLSGALSATIVARTIVIVALAYDLTATNHNTAMAIMKWGEGGLLKAKR